MSSIEERTMNIEALRTAVRAFAPQQADGIEYLYVLLDDSMKRGYAAGVYDATEQLEIERDNAWDHGYLQGVGDARAHPNKADTIVQDIIADGAATYYDGAQAFSGMSDEDVATWDAYIESAR